MARRRTDRIAIAVLVGCGVTALACRHRARDHGEAVVIPSTTSAIELDGEWEESAWDREAAQRTFKTDGVEARPFSEIRMLHDRDTLYVTLYAADENVLSTEAFELKIGKLSTSINPQGHLTPAIPGVKTGADLDGTLDVETDYDEEWVIELAIPFAATGISTDDAVPLHVARCDVPKAGGRSCSAWDGSIILGGT